MPIPAILGTIAGLGLEYGPKAIGVLNRLVNPTTQGTRIRRVVKKKAPARRARVRRAPARKRRVYYY